MFGKASTEKSEPARAPARKSVRSKSILFVKDERMKVYFPHDLYIWISGEIITEVRKNEYDVYIDDHDIPHEVIESIKKYCGKLEVLPLQNENMSDEGVDDMVTLNFLHEASILDNLRRRYKHKLPYTYVGNICMAVNPYQWIGELYTKELKNTHLHNLRHDMKPHVYGTSASSYKGLRDFNKNQSILVSGESGAGKTETVKILMAHLAHISLLPDTRSDESNNIIIEKVLQSNPLLESFGNAKTGRNDNSSRFGKFTQLQFDAEERGTSLIGSRCVTYLLEKSRVITQNDSKERNYHIFHQLFAAPDHIKEQLFMMKTVIARDFRYTSAGDTKTNMIEGESDASRFMKTMEALALLGVDEATRNHVQAVVAGVLYLGQVNFIGDTERSSIESSQLPLVSHCCLLLGLDVAAFMESTTSRSLVVSGESNSLSVPLSRDQAIDARDALAKDLYFRLFSWLVLVINNSTAVTEASNKPHERTISLLDIFGFEYFVINRFEQLNINYANEKLQQKFTEDVFATVQAEYKSEGLQWENISYKDNSDVLDLLEGKQGVFASLNEECCVPKGSDMNYLSKLSTRQGKHSCFSQNVHMSRDGFCIHHYAGKVTYNVTGFVERNRDTLLADMRTLMLLSRNELIYQIYSPLDWSNPATNGSMSFTRGRSNSEPESDVTSSYDVTSPSNRIGISSKSYATTPTGSSKRGESYLKSETVLTKFKSQLTSLMTSISRTNVQYVRCIKPNAIKSATVYDRNMVVEQLRCAGVIEAIRISRAAYPYRLTHTEFLDHFGILRPASWYDGPRSIMTQGAKCKALLDDILASDQHGHKQRSPSPLPSSHTKSTPFEVGKTRIYFSAGVLEILEKMRSDIFSNATLLMQTIIRGYIQRCRYHRMRLKVIVLQSIIRGFIYRQSYYRYRQACIKMQATIRQFCAKLYVYHYRLYVRASTIQSYVRMKKHARVYNNMRQASRTIQCWYKMIYQRKRYKISLEHAKKQSDLQKQLDSMKRRLQDEEAYRIQLQQDMEIRLEQEKREMERTFRLEMQEQLAREEEERLKLIKATIPLVPEVIASPVMIQQETVVNEQMIREQIRRELEESMHVERELLRQQLRDEMRLEVQAASSNIISSPSALNDHISLQLPFQPISSGEALIQRATTPTAPTKRPSILSTGSGVVIAKQQERTNSPMVGKPHTPSQSEFKSSSNTQTKSPTTSSVSLSSYTGIVTSASASVDTSPHSNDPMLMMSNPLTPKKNQTERRGSSLSSESGLTSLESNINAINSDHGMDVATMSSMQSELKKYQRKVDFLTKENVALKSIVRSDNDDGPVIRNDRDIRDRASMQATVHSLKSDLERMTNNINQMKDEKAQMLATWSQLTAELELSNAQRDDYARKLEHEKEAYHEQNRMTILFLASKRVDPMIIQELKNMFAVFESHHHSLSPSHEDMLHGSSQKSSRSRHHPNHMNQKSTMFMDSIPNNNTYDDDMSIISSISTHRENHSSSIDDNFLEYDNYHNTTSHQVASHTQHITPLPRSSSSRMSPPSSSSLQKSSSSSSSSRSKSRFKYDNNPAVRPYDNDDGYTYESNPYAKQQLSPQNNLHTKLSPSLRKSSNIPVSTPHPPSSSSTSSSSSTPNPTPHASKFGQKPKQYDEEPITPTTSPAPAPSSTGGKELLDQTANLLNWMVPGLWQSPSQS